MAAGFARAGDVRNALNAITSDPAYGPAVLSEPAPLANLLADYLPDAQRETGLLLAAAKAGIAGELQAHIAAGMDAATAIRIVAAHLASATAYSAEGCAWVAGEFAIALGLTAAGAIPEPVLPDQERVEQAAPLPAAGASWTEPRPTLGLTLAEPGKRRPRRVGVAVALAIAAVILAGGTATVLAFAHKPERHPSSAGGQRSPSGRKTPGRSPSSAAPAVETAPVVSIGDYTGRDPTVIGFSGDAGNVVSGIIWSSWTATGAQGLGKSYLDNCVPNCAAGTTTLAPAEIVLSVPVDGRFTVMLERRAGATSTWLYPDQWPLDASGTGHTTQASQQKPPGGSELWTSPTVTITSRSLGAVTIGMTLAQASAYTGVPLQQVGDNFFYPGGSSNSGLYVGGLTRVQCLGATLSGYGPTVVTSRGFPLGGTLAELKATYGPSLAFVPAPSSGYFPVPGYIVAFSDGNLAFRVSHGIVTQIEAGPGVRPSSCTG